MKIRQILNLVLLAFPLFLLASCTTDDENYDKQLVGTWYVDRTKTKLTLETKGDKDKLEKVVMDDYSYRSLTFNSNQSMVILFDDILTRAREDEAKGEYDAKDNRLSLYLDNGENKYLQYYVNGDELKLIIDATADYQEATMVQIELYAYKNKR